MQETRGVEVEVEDEDVSRFCHRLCPKWAGLSRPWAFFPATKSQLQRQTTTTTTRDTCFPRYQLLSRVLVVNSVYLPMLGAFALLSPYLESVLASLSNAARQPSFTRSCQSSSSVIMSPFSNYAAKSQVSQDTRGGLSARIHKRFGHITVIDGLSGHELELGFPNSNICDQ